MAAVQSLLPSAFTPRTLIENGFSSSAARQVRNANSARMGMALLAKSPNAFGFNENTRVLGSIVFVSLLCVRFGLSQAQQAKSELQ